MEHPADLGPVWRDLRHAELARAAEIGQPAGGQHPAGQAVRFLRDRARGGGHRGRVLCAGGLRLFRQWPERFQGRHPVLLLHSDSGGGRHPVPDERRGEGQGRAERGTGQWHLVGAQGQAGVAHRPQHLLRLLRLLRSDLLYPLPEQDLRPAGGPGRRLWHHQPVLPEDGWGSHRRHHRRQSVKVPQSLSLLQLHGQYPHARPADRPAP
ncbi:hypothetical protein D3C85_954090 [compost metagenome]